jgi:hypothetical protein
MPRKVLSTLASKRNGPVVFNEQASRIFLSQERKTEGGRMFFGFKFMFVIIKPSMYVKMCLNKLI